MKTSSDSADRRPVDPATGRPLVQREAPGYYPGFSTLAQQKFWDEATRRKVLDRVHKVPSIRFFTPEEARLMEAVTAHVLPQDDRMPSRRKCRRTGTRTGSGSRRSSKWPRDRMGARFKCFRGGNRTSC